MSDLETPKVNRGFVAGPGNAVVVVAKINRGFVVRPFTASASRAQVFIRYGDGGR